MSNTKYYGIRNKKTGKFISGTDFRYQPPHQRSSNEWRPPLLISKAHPLLLEVELARRKINMKRYEVVEVIVKEANH